MGIQGMNSGYRIDSEGLYRSVISCTAPCHNPSLIIHSDILLSTPSLHCHSPPISTVSACLHLCYSWGSYGVVQYLCLFISRVSASKHSYLFIHILTCTLLYFHLSSSFASLFLSYVYLFQSALPHCDPP